MCPSRAPRSTTDGADAVPRLLPAPASAPHCVGEAASALRRSCRAAGCSAGDAGHGDTLELGSGCCAAVHGCRAGMAAAVRCGGARLGWPRAARVSPLSWLRALGRGARALAAAAPSSRAARAARRRGSREPLMRLAPAAVHLSCCTLGRRQRPSLPSSHLPPPHAASHWHRSQSRRRCSATPADSWPLTRAACWRAPCAARLPAGSTRLPASSLRRRPRVAARGRRRAVCSSSSIPPSRRPRRSSSSTTAVSSSAPTPPLQSASQLRPLCVPCPILPCPAPA